jgi:hypothetical protein
LNSSSPSSSSSSSSLRRRSDILRNNGCFPARPAQQQTTGALCHVAR